MWSKLSEYAEGIAEIVAQADATAAAAVAAEGAGGSASLPRDSAADGGSSGDAPPRSSKGEELWSRFASIVAPPSSTGADAAPLSQRSRDAADAGASATTDTSTLAENEQEQYICELERALLQRKKQNEALEKHAYELEFKLEHERAQLREKDTRIAALAHERTQLQPHEHAAFSSPEAAATVANVARLEQRLRDLNARCSAVQDTLAAVQGGRAPVESSADDVIERVRDEDRPPALSAEPTARTVALERVLSSFLAQHGEELPSGASVAGADVEAVASTLRRLSERIERDASAAADAARLQAKVQTLTEQDEEQLKKLLHLQAQVTSMQASADKAERSLQDTASEEAAALRETIAERDADVRRLEANVVQLRTSMEHLADELREAQNYADELEDFCRRQKKELDAQRTRTKELEPLEAALDEQRDQERAARAQAAEFEQRYEQLVAELESVRAESAEASKLHAASAKSQAIFALEARLSASEADKAIAVQDAERLQTNVDALEGVLHQFQVDQKQQRERLCELETALTAARNELTELKSAHVDATSRTSDSASDLERVMEVLAKKTLECDQLREALETSASRYAADNDVLDKRLAAQLVVAYCETEKKAEVLQLIAGMMGFSEEQKRRVGLGFPGDGTSGIVGGGGGGLFSSLLGLVAPPPGDSAVAVDIDGKSFSDIWTEFLINEAKK